MARRALAMAVGQPRRRFQLSSLFSEKLRADHQLLLVDVLIDYEEIPRKVLELVLKKIFRFVSLTSSFPEIIKWEVVRLCELCSRWKRNHQMILSVLAKIEERSSSHTPRYASDNLDTFLLSLRILGLESLLGKVVDFDSILPPHLRLVENNNVNKDLKEGIQEFHAFRKAFSKNFQVSSRN